MNVYNQAREQELADELHRRGLRLVLDGVFNHMGRRSPMFEEALRIPHRKWHPFFKFSEKYDRGYIGWIALQNFTSAGGGHRLHDRITCGTIPTGE